MNSNLGSRHNNQINHSNTIQFLKSHNAVSLETAVEISSEEWFELGFELGAPLGSFALSPVKRTTHGKYWYDRKSAKSYILFYRIFAIIAVTIFLLIVIYVISFIGQQNQRVQDSLRQPHIDFYSDKFLQN